MGTNQAQAVVGRPDGSVTVSTSKNKFMYLTENEALSGDVHYENGAPDSMTLLTKRPKIFVVGARVTFKNKYPAYSWIIRNIDSNPGFGRHKVMCDFPERIYKRVPCKKTQQRYTTGK